MTALSRTWSRLTLPGKLIFSILPVVLVLTVGLIAVLVLFGPTIIQFLADNIWLVRFVVAATAILVMSIPTAFLIIYMEMKGIALMNLRIGPDRVGPFGSLLSVVHGLKVLAKEDFSPTGTDRLVFTLAPVVVYMATIMGLLVIPFAPGLFGQDMSIALLYFFAVGGLTVVGLLMLAGTMSLNQLAENQAGWFTNWYVFQQPLGALIFFIAATAEANRTPFDLTEADSEIVAGFATEYSGMRFGFLFFAEYVNVFIISALMVTLYFGAWNAPFPFPEITLNLDLGSLGVVLLLLLVILPPVLTLIFALPFWLASGNRPAWQALVLGFIVFNVVAMGLLFGILYIETAWVAGLVWFMVKSFLFVFVFVWMRGTLPRVRIDQLMNFAWKWLLPASLLNLFITAAAIVVVKQLTSG